MLSIGEFSKLCMVTTKTLRHYDLIGLLKPKELNNENGYKVVRPPYEKYVNDPATTPKQDLITEIYFPIEK